MESKLNWKRTNYITGVVLMIAGALDPKGGAIAIVTGSILTAITTSITKDRHQKIFIINCVLICVGALALFILSSLGGFDGSSKLSYWWGLFILPYPIGWIAMITLLIIRWRNPQQVIERTDTEQK